MIVIFLVFGMVCYIMLCIIFFVYGMIIFFILDNMMYFYELKYFIDVKIYYIIQWNNIKVIFYIFILIFLF